MQQQGSGASNPTKSFQQLVYRRDRERSLKIDAECVIIATFGRYIWKIQNTEYHTSTIELGSQWWV